MSGQCWEEFEAAEAAHKEAAAQWQDEARLRRAAEARADHLLRALFLRGVSEAPCDICGYCGPDYYQPSTHKCIGEAYEARRAAKGCK